MDYTQMEADIMEDELQYLFDRNEQRPISRPLMEMELLLSPESFGISYNKITSYIADQIDSGRFIERTKYILA